MKKGRREIAKAYARGWIRHEPQKIADLFNGTGIYIDPLLDRELKQAEIAEHAARYFSIFPDLSFEGGGDFIENHGVIAAQWIMRGSCKAKDDNGKTGFSMEIPGADFIRVEAGRILSVHAYFDHRRIPGAIRNGFKPFPASQKEAKAKKYAKSALSREKARLIRSEIETLMKKKMPHRECGFGLGDLARLMDLSTNHVSQVINSEFRKNFYDYVNGLRIEEAKNLLINPDRMGQSVLDIALEVGFGSKSTFNAAFKKHTRQTPSQFIKTNLLHRPPTE